MPPHSISRKVFVIFAVLSSKKIAECGPITNSDLIDHVREFSSKNDSINSTGINTLQKEEARYANFAPGHNPVRFKDVPDSALSSSSYSRGLHHEPGYPLHEYEEGPPVYGYEYHAVVPGHHGYGHHGYDHHGPDHYHGHGHHEVNYHHKHYDHALAAKAFLWPIAGLALLGAAAAFVSNPVLLQLGVVSGRRKRRDTEETFDTHDTELSWLKEDAEGHEDSKVTNSFIKGRGKKKSSVEMYKDSKLKHRVPVKYAEKQEALFKELRVHPTVQSPVEIAVDNVRFNGNRNINDNKLIPVPLLIKD